MGFSLLKGVLLESGDIVAIVVAVVSSGGFGALVPWVLGKFDHKPNPQVVALQEQLCEQKERANILEQGMRALLFDKLARLHEETVAKGLPVSVDIKRRAETTYTAYKALGGNGVGTHLYEEILDAHVGGGYDS